MSIDDSAWRRPPAGPWPDRVPTGPDPGTPGPGGAGRRVGAVPPATGGYTGPPPTLPPAPGWRPPTVIQPVPPRELPAQDPDEIDNAEREARTLTYGVGLVAGAIMLIMLCVVCGRWLL